MKILVTGANGFLASNIIRELNRREINVRAMVRSTADLKSLLGTEHELFYGKFTNMLETMEAVKGCDIVIHAAADTSHHYMNAEPYLYTNVLGTLNLLEAAYKNNVKKFIFVSTANAFGFGTKSSPGNENTPARYPFTASGYAISKFKAQQLVIEYASTGKLDALVVNPTFMIGPYDTKPSSGRMITLMFNRKFIPVPPGGKNFIHVRDVATGICNAIEKGRSGSCYLLANENLSYREFYQKLANIAGRKYKYVNLSPKLLKWMGFAGTMVMKTGIKSNLNFVNASMLCTDNYYSSAKAIAELQLPQTPIDNAISDAINWFVQEGYI